MSENKHSVAMFKQIDGERKQIGWASPVNPETHARTFERSPGFENESLSGVSFEDDELSQQAAEEQGEHEADIEVVHDTVIEPTQEELDALNGDDEEESEEEVVEAPETDVEEVPETDEDDSNYPQAGDEGKDSAPLQVENNETVELNSGGEIQDVDGDDNHTPQSDEEAEEAEFQRLLEEEQAQSEAPQTRREARENEETN